MQLDFLRQELHRTISNLELLFDKLEAHEFYSPNSSAFLKIFKQFTRVLRQNIHRIPGGSYSLVLEILNYEVIPLLRYVQRSETREIPWSLVPNFEALVRKSLGPSYIVILRPQWNWNYSVVITDISEYLQERIYLIFSRRLLRLKEKVHVISFPVLEKTNFLLHTVVGHELGHFFQKEYFEKYLTPKWESTLRNRLIATRRRRRKPHSKKHTPRTSLIVDAEETIEIYKGMVREIMPDMIGYIILGPSIVFAHYFFHFWSEDLEPPSEENEYYPPLKYRIRILNDNFLKSDLLQIHENPLGDPHPISPSAQKRFKLDLTNYLSVADDLELLNEDRQTREARHLFENSLPHILSFVKTRTKKIAYKYSQKRIESLIRRIQDTIPPNELDGRPVELGDIFTSGWVYYFHLLCTDKAFANKGKDYITQYQWLSRLLLKASNLSYIQTFYRAMRHASP